MTKLLVVLAASAALAMTTAAPAAAEIAPRLECATANVASNTVTATWGYVHTGDTQITLLPGSDNFFKPSPSFQGQPVVFQPGDQHDVFQSTFDLAFDSSSTWDVLGIGETASLDSRSCFRLDDPPERRADASILGDPVVGRRLALDPGVLAGEVQQVDLQWQRDEPAGEDTWEDIDGADTASYVPTASDSGHRLRVQITARSIANVIHGAADTNGATVTLTDPSAVVAPAPVAGTPSITGTPRVGQTLTASPGTWTGVSSFAYDWQRCIAHGCASTGSTGTSYSLTAADVGKRLRVVVTPSGDSQPAAASAETDAVDTPPTPSALTLTPATIDFGPVRVGRVATRRATVKNTGTTPIIIGGIIRGGPAAADFSPLSTCALFSQLAAGRSCTVDVVFSPHALGTRTGSLKVFDDQGDGPGPAVLTGTGVSR